MLKLFFLVTLFFFSLLVIFRAPTYHLWYLSILVTELAWILILLVPVLLLLPSPSSKPNLLALLIATVTVSLLIIPYWQAIKAGKKLVSRFDAAFSVAPATFVETPFRWATIFSGIGSRPVQPNTFVYDSVHRLSLCFYPAQKRGDRPCVVVIHGGSWSGGDNRQLPELNSELAKTGYHVASINYRLAPAYRFPAPVEDLKTAIQFLKQNAAAFLLDTNQFVLLGRSAGGQIALTAGYTLSDPSIKGVIDFYGPADMVWGYQNPTNPLVLNSRDVIENYLGGGLNEVPKQYIQSSATETATADSPPTLMIYGGNDPLVSPKHGGKLAVKLESTGTPQLLLYLPWATHGFDYTLNGPGGQLSTWAVKRFLEAILNEQ